MAGTATRGRAGRRRGLFAAFTALACSIGMGALPATASAQAAPAPPSGFTVGAISTTAIRVAWTQSPTEGVRYEVNNGEESRIRGLQVTSAEDGAGWLAFFGT
ncbi:hypothetical protein [Geodermatophilus sabuli]|uniref:Fibronectin type III domain-containing protein n=1 Tax=Geodermatophilus sabuli TaxID=1564158 RepID=A0A285EG23_9ACTN|nr:hypothetical protein [Geodermatophilus sabuli]MBB3082928.1 hypothetical protein [Geodermatophilus sabuli]SNX97927.1 hypothetical protein SAMN06893097_1097 [Geodermatophilus sabuli]